MLGSLQIAAPTGVIPYALSNAFSESREYVQLQAQYHDGSTDRSQLAQTSRRTFKLSQRLTALLTDALKAFWDGQLGGVVPFLFYNLAEGAYGSTGNSTQGCTRSLSGRTGPNRLTSWSASDCRMPARGDTGAVIGFRMAGGVRHPSPIGFRPSAHHGSPCGRRRSGSPVPRHRIFDLVFHIGQDLDSKIRMGPIRTTWSERPVGCHGGERVPYPARVRVRRRVRHVAKPASKSRKVRCRCGQCCCWRTHGGNGSSLRISRTRTTTTALSRVQHRP